MDVSAYRRAYFALVKSLGLSDEARHDFNHVPDRKMVHVGIQRGRLAPRRFKTPARCRPGRSARSPPHPRPRQRAGRHVHASSARSDSQNGQPGHMVRLAGALRAIPPLAAPPQRDLGRPLGIALPLRSLARHRRLPPDGQPPARGYLTKSFRTRTSLEFVTRILPPAWHAVCLGRCPCNNPRVNATSLPLIRRSRSIPFLHLRQSPSVLYLQPCPLANLGPIAVSRRPL